MRFISTTALLSSESRQGDPETGDWRGELRTGNSSQWGKVSYEELAYDPDEKHCKSNDKSDIGHSLLVLLSPDYDQECRECDLAQVGSHRRWEYDDSLTNTQCSATQ